MRAMNRAFEYVSKGYSSASARYLRSLFLLASIAEAGSVTNLSKPVRAILDNMFAHERHREADVHDWVMRCRAIPAIERNLAETLAVEIWPHYERMLNHEPEPEVKLPKYKPKTPEYPPEGTFNLPVKPTTDDAYFGTPTNPEW